MSTDDPDDQLAETEAATAKRLAAIRRVRGSYTDVYDRDYLRDLRTDWPA